MTRNIEYWVDYWASLFTGIEHKRFSLSMLSPRILLRELIEEIETRSLKNGDNRKFLFDKINYYFKTDPPTIRCLKNILTLIRREFAGPRHDILVQLCHRCLDLMDSLVYFDCSVDYLSEILLAEKPVTRTDLLLVCQDLIVELNELGYSNKFIADIPGEIFGDYIENEGILFTRFPHDIPYPDDPSSELIKAYNENLKAYIDGLSDKDRLNSIKKYPRKTKNKHLFIFQVRGIKGQGSFTVGPIYFYSPTEEQKIKDNKLLPALPNLEFFGENEHIYLNAAVPIETADIHSGASQARHDLIHAINILRFTINSKARFELSNNYLVVDELGRMSGASFSHDPNAGFLHWNESLSVDDKISRVFEKNDNLQKAATALIGTIELDITKRKLLDSLHWFRKAKEAESPEDQILWYWISIESLLSFLPTSIKKELLRTKDQESVVTLAFDLLPRIRTVTNTYDRGWILYKELFSIFAVPLPLRPFSIPEILLQSSGLNKEDGRLNLNKFVTEIPNILKHIPDTVLREHLEEANQFYNDKNFAIKSIENEKDAFRSDIVMLYRTRNKIVHSATISNPTMAYFTRSAQEFSKGLISNVFKQYFSMKNKSLSKIVSSIFSEYDLLLENIKQNGPRKALF